MIAEEFEAPEQVTLRGVKDRIKDWLRTSRGSHYISTINSETSITLTREEHDNRICAVGCVLVFVLPVILLLVLSRFVTSYSQVINLLSIVIIVIGTIEVVAVYLYCLRREKAVCHVELFDAQPVLIRTLLKGAIQKASRDYLSLKGAIQRDRRVMGHNW